MPRDRLAIYMRIPSPQRSFGLALIRGIPELAQPSLGDDPHPMLLLSVIGIWLIVVRKIRTVNGTSSGIVAKGEGMMRGNNPARAIRHRCTLTADIFRC